DRCFTSGTALALGIAVNTAVFTFVNAVLYRPCHSATTQRHPECSKAQARVAFAKAVCPAFSINVSIAHVGVLPQLAGAGTVCGPGASRLAGGARRTRTTLAARPRPTVAMDVDTQASSGPQNVQISRRLARVARLTQIIDLLAEDSRRSVCVGELEGRPSGASTIRPVGVELAVQQTLDCGGLIKAHSLEVGRELS